MVKSNSRLKIGPELSYLTGMVRLKKSKIIQSVEFGSVVENADCGEAKLRTDVVN